MDIKSTLNIRGSLEQSQEEMELETEVKALELERQILEKERHLQDARENLAKPKAARVSDTEGSISDVGQLSSSMHRLQNHSSSSSSILSDTDWSTTASLQTAATPRRRQRHVQHTQREEQREVSWSRSVGDVKMLMTWRICLIVAGLLVSCSTLYFVTYSELPDMARIILTQSDRITVAWRSPGGRYDGFRLECYDAHSNDRCVTDVTRDVNEGSCTDLIPGTKYDVTVTTMVEGKPSRATTYVGLVRTALAVPSRPKVRSVKLDKITVSWSAPQGNYDIVRLICTTKDGTQKHTDVHRGHNSIGTCNGLESGIEYYITLATMMYDKSVDAQMDIFDLVRTERTYMRAAYDVISGNKCAIGGAILTSILAPMAAPAALGALGFGATGIGAGTVAASMMSSAALAGGGGIAAGSLVALLQSAGAAGIGVVTKAALVAIGSVVGAGVGAATCTEGCG